MPSSKTVGLLTPSANQPDKLSIPKRSWWRVPVPDRTARGRASLALATVVVAGIVVLVLVAALPGPRAEWKHGIETALGKPVVLAVLGTVVVSGLLWCIRMWVLLKRMRDPGPIHLVGLEDGTVAAPPPAVVTVQSSEGGPATSTALLAAPAAMTADGPPVARLAMHLRERLTQLRFTVPSAMPGRPSSTDFVELLGTTKLDLKQPLAIVGKLLRLVRPTHAYEVKATLLKREAPMPFGVSIEITVLLGRRTTFRTYWDDNWEKALNRATNAVGAVIVPLTRGSRRGPWSGARGKTLDHRVFDAYQCFQRYSRENRYEEAMDALYQALRLDPANHHLRFQLGLLQEELALYLDALLTYHSIRQGLKERIRGGVSRRERRELRRLELLARYRATILLGWGERLAEQWAPPLATRARSKRSQELEHIRARLSPILIERYKDITVEPWDREKLEFAEGREAEGIEAMFSAVAQPAATRSRRTRDAARLRLLFELCARHDVQRFMREYKRRHLRPLKTEITFVGIQLLPAWAGIRAHAARHALAELLGEDPDQVPLGIGGKEPEWPLAPVTVRALWGREDDKPGHQERRARQVARSLQRSKVFLDHYNAACTFAVALLLEPAKTDAEAERRRETVAALASEAIDELECAVHVGGSRKFAAQWDWILREDPDLSGLRPEADFLRFESERFPYSQPAPLRPTEIVRLVAARHSAQLCSAGAAIREQEWHRRADRAAATNPHDALAWWEEEAEAWQGICDLARDHRSWQTRLDLIRQMQAFCAANGLKRFAVPRPPYSDQPIEASHEEIDIHAGREIQHLDKRISTLRKELEDHDHPRQLAAWERYLHRLDVAGKALDAETTRRLANNRASAWGDLRIAMERRLTGADDLHAATWMLKTAAATMSALPLPRTAHTAAASLRRRVLVVANRTLDGEELRAELLLRGQAGADFHVVAPTLALRSLVTAHAPGAPRPFTTPVLAPRAARLWRRWWTARGAENGNGAGVPTRGRSPLNAR